MADLKELRRDTNKRESSSDRLGGVVRDRIEQFRPSKAESYALHGEMEWKGGNNNVPADSMGKAKAKYK